MSQKGHITLEIRQNMGYNISILTRRENHYVYIRL